MTFKQLTKNISNWEVTHYTATYKPTGFQMWIDGYELNLSILDEGNKKIVLDSLEIVQLWRWLRSLRALEKSIIIGNLENEHVMFDKLGNVYIDGEKCNNNTKIVQKIKQLASI